ncbi:MAG: response regulator [Hyphomicrobiaceae bacterium]|nr:response regulator [Hyphomicrobiaceae bacterium]
MAVVVLDDCAFTTAILKSLAGARGEREVATFTEPRSALSYLERNRALLIIADCSMPEMDGLEFTRAVREQELHRDTPVVMVSGVEDPAIPRMAAEAGASAFVAKPVNMARFKALVTEIIERGRRPAA